MRWKSIRYRDFWDQPRIFVVEDAGDTLLFDCKFDDEVEDFPDDYQIYILPPLSAEDYESSWAPFRDRAIAYLGSVPLNAVRFDPTMRQAIDASILDRFPRPAQAIAHESAGS